MDQHVFIYVRSHLGTEAELLHDLRQTVEDRGDTVIGTFADDGRIAGRGKYAGWRDLLGRLDAVDQVIVGSAGDLPGRTVNDLLKILDRLRAHDVALRLHGEQIDTGDTSFALLAIIEAYRRAKLSQAIKTGQAKALAAGKRIGRPTIPKVVVTRIQASLANGGGIRSTARKFNVSPASIINIRRTMNASPDKLAA
jgi:hypothetical protein